MDAIFIEQLRLQAHVGIYPRECLAAQSVDLDLTFGVPAAAVQEDDIAQTIDYAAVIQRLRIELGERHFNLLETLAEWVAQLLLHEFNAPWVRIAISKPGVAPDVRRVGVRIERHQPHTASSRVGIQA